VVVEALPVAADDVDAQQVVVRSEARAPDQRFVGALDPVVCADPRGRDAIDGGGDEIDVVALQGRVVIARDEDALASEGVVGRELRTQLGIGDLALEVGAGGGGKLPAPGVVGQEQRGSLRQAVSQRQPAESGPDDGDLEPLRHALATPR